MSVDFSFPKTGCLVLFLIITSLSFVWELDLKAIMLCVTFSDCSHLQKLPLSLLQCDNINERCVSTHTARWFSMLKYSGESIICPQSSTTDSHCLLLIYLSVFSPALAISAFLSFFSCSATQIDSAFLISQHNPINFIVITAINI